MSDKHRLLLVDDDKLMLAMLTDALSHEYHVETAPNGAVAMARLREDHDFRGVLCDHIMPEVTGVEVLEACLSQAPSTARILITASEDVKDVRDAVNRARVHRVVSKPFRSVDVESVVRGAIHEVELEQENARLVVELRDALDDLQRREHELETELAIRTQELKDVMAQLVQRTQ